MSGITNGVEHRGTEPALTGRSWVKSTVAAVLFAETLIADHVFIASPAPAASAASARNAFGDPVSLVRGDSAIELCERFVAAAALGERVTLIASAHSLLAARERLEDVARRRLGTVVHLIADRSVAVALAYADLGWGLLFASSVEDSFDLALIARRAAEDSGTPFFVVHESHAQVQHVESIGVASTELVTVFVGAPSTRLHKEDHVAHPAHASVGERAFLERVPFALGSAMRELEQLTGRRHDVIERIPASDTALVLVGLGELGESLLAQVERLRDAGHDVGAVKITALRPFPAVRLVKMLGRALAVTVIEAVDEPLAQSNPVTRELKAAFVDAITWAPGYPGVGRVPRVVSGFVGRGKRELDAIDAESIVANMAQGEREVRSFVLGANAATAEGKNGQSDDASATSHLAHVPSSTGVPGPTFSLRVRVPSPVIGEATAELCAQVIMSALGMRARATVRPAPLADAGETVVDLFAARERPRGVHPPHAVKYVLLDNSTSLLHGHPLARLGTKGTLAFPTTHATGEGVWSELPAYAKALIFDRHARVVGFKKPELEASEPWAHAALVAGVAVGCAAPPGRPLIDGSRLAREVESALAVVLGPAHLEAARRAGAIARTAMESVVEVPRAVIERDEESIRLGRRDARASDFPR